MRPIVFPFACEKHVHFSLFPPILPQLSKKNIWSQANINSPKCYIYSFALSQFLFCSNKIFDKQFEFEVSNQSDA